MVKKRRIEYQDLQPNVDIGTVLSTIRRKFALKLVSVNAFFRIKPDCNIRTIRTI